MKRDLIQEYDMLPDHGTVLCAVSGGADSMCLLVWLCELSQEYGYTVAAAHFHHGLRGETADRDEAFVKEFCQKRGIAFYAGRGNVTEAARENGWSVEEAGRNLRYAFLAKTAEQIRAVRIATAHHQGDQAETVLMNLIRGTGMTGLSGIAPVRGPYIRPLLNTSREEIESYLERNGIAFVQDETNEDTVYTRNRIRHEIMPLLRQINPKAEESMAKTATLLRREDQYLQEKTEEICAAVRRSEYWVELERQTLNALPAAMQNRVIRRMLDLLGVEKKDLSAGHVCAIVTLIRDSGPTAQLSLPRGVIAQNIQESFRIRKQDDSLWQRTMLPPVGEVCIGPWQLQCRTVDGGAQELPGRVILCSDAICAPVFVDRWQDGRIILQGKAESRSLKRAFLDAGFSIEKRDETPVVYIGDRIAAIPGIGVAAEFADNGTGHQFVVDFQRK